MSHIHSELLSLTAPLEGVSNLICLDQYLTAINRSRCTFWRWQKLGLIKAVNVCGRNYIARDEIRRFEEAAVRGDFARQLPRPSARSRRAKD